MNTILNVRSLRVLATSVGLFAVTATVAIAGGGVSVTWTSPMIVGNDVQIMCKGNPAETYILQGTTNLTNIQWTGIYTNTTGPAGMALVVDSNAVTLYPQRFYPVIPR
jgi:hypothetical protein